MRLSISITRRVCPSVRPSVGPEQLAKLTMSFVSKQPRLNDKSGNKQNSIFIIIIIIIIIIVVVVVVKATLSSCCRKCMLTQMGHVEREGLPSYLGLWIPRDNNKLVYQTPKMHRNHDYKHGPHSGRPRLCRGKHLLSYSYYPLVFRACIEFNKSHSSGWF